MASMPIACSMGAMSACIFAIKWEPARILRCAGCHLMGGGQMGEDAGGRVRSVAYSGLQFVSQGAAFGCRTQIVPFRTDAFPLIPVARCVNAFPDRGSALARVAVGVQKGLDILRLAGARALLDGMHGPDDLDDCVLALPLLLPPPLWIAP